MSLSTRFSRLLALNQWSPASACLLSSCVELWHWRQADPPLLQNSCLGISNSVNLCVLCSYSLFLCTHCFVSIFRFCSALYIVSRMFQLPTEAEGMQLANILPWSHQYNDQHFDVYKLVGSIYYGGCPACQRQVDIIMPLDKYRLHIKGVAFQDIFKTKLKFTEPGLRVDKPLMTSG